MPVSDQIEIVATWELNQSIVGVKITPVTL
jgi:hypothetical protein